MSRPTGRSRHDRLRALRFALWAKDKPAREITPLLISAMFGISMNSARRWRNDWLLAISPIEIEYLPAPLNSPPPVTYSATTRQRGSSQGSLP